jgi:NAD+ diphosphatase
MPFKPNFRTPTEILNPAKWFLFRDQQLLLRQEGKRYLIPDSLDLENLNITPKHPLFLGSLNDCPCYAGQLDDVKQVSSGYSTLGRMEFFSQLEEEEIMTAGLANQLVLWNQNHRFCGRCGNPMEDKSDERARICPKCGMVNYPRLSPAIIVAVIKDNQILLASAKRFPAKFYSVLAGFVEPGETLEECVKREVQEEVGINVKNICYFGSQPWPFPDSLMIAFTAEHDGGEITLNSDEIDEAGWFTSDSLPQIPPKVSIARRLIDWFIQMRSI